MAIDKDLLFLNRCSNAQLQTLADMLVYDTAGKPRTTESLTNTRAYRCYYPHQMKELIPAMVDELQRFGGNSIANAFRGHGVSYRVILLDICTRLRVDCDRKASVASIEESLLKTILRHYVGTMTDKQVAALGQSVSRKALLSWISGMSPDSPMFIRLMRVVFDNFFPRRGRVQPIPLAGGLNHRSFALLGVQAAILFPYLVNLPGPAYRVTIPSVIFIAYLRIASGLSDQELNEKH